MVSTISGGCLPPPPSVRSSGVARRSAAATAPSTPGEILGRDAARNPWFSWGFKQQPWWFYRDSMAKIVLISWGKKHDVWDVTSHVLGISWDSGKKMEVEPTTIGIFYWGCNWNNSIIDQLPLYREFIAGKIIYTCFFSSKPCLIGGYAW